MFVVQGEVSRDVDTKELKALHSPLSFLYFYGIYVQFIVRTQFLSNAEPPPCRGVSYQSYNSDTISKFDDGLIGVNGATVMGKKGAEEGAEDTPLWCTCVQD